MMDATPITKEGFFRHFTFRDIFYMVGLIVTVVTSIVLNWVMLQNRLDTNEREFQREIVHAHAFEARTVLRLDSIEKMIQDINQTGTLASKSANMHETTMLKGQQEQISRLQQQWQETAIKIERIDTNVVGLIKQAEKAEQSRN